MPLSPKAFQALELSKSIIEKEQELDDLHLRLAALLGEKPPVIAAGDKRAATAKAILAPRTKVIEPRKAAPPPCGQVTAEGR